MREAAIKLFNDYFSIAFEAKYKTIHAKGIPSMSAGVACGRVAKVYDCKSLKDYKFFKDYQSLLYK